ncbi:hypothetical protein CEXT_192811 [Caerostris extrusa]|uniref:Uncharacterized protein n=1 Tax=Caerostris extrusa TaxID=172846 RepID=A0AAV4XYM4_CAEEX|nr:hypothetical protein CEXT_192811 [Caerostris extrusa]
MSAFLGHSASSSRRITLRNLIIMFRQKWSRLNATGRPSFPRRGEGGDQEENDSLKIRIPRHAGISEWENFLAKSHRTKGSNESLHPFPLLAQHESAFLGHSASSSRRITLRNLIIIFRQKWARLKPRDAPISTGGGRQEEDI